MHVLGLLHNCVHYNNCNHYHTGGTEEEPHQHSSKEVCKLSTVYVIVVVTIYVTEFAKRGLIHASSFPTLTSYNFICKQAIKLKFLVLLVQ